MAVRASGRPKMSGTTLKVIAVERAAGSRPGPATTPLRSPQPHARVRAGRRGPMGERSGRFASERCQGRCRELRSC